MKDERDGDDDADSPIVRCRTPDEQSVVEPTDAAGSRTDDVGYVEKVVVVVTDARESEPIRSGGRKRKYVRRLRSKKQSTKKLSVASTTTSVDPAAPSIVSKATRGKKPKRVDNRKFQSRWTDLFGFVENDGRALCVFCQETVSRKTYSVQRHFQTLHSRYFTSDDEKTQAIVRGLSTLDTQRNVLEMAKKEKQYATEASFALTLCIIEKGKPFIEGEFIKSTFLACAETLFEDFRNKDEILKRINDIPASKSTIQRRISELAADIFNQQTTFLLSCDVFSVALEDTLDGACIRRLTVFARYVADDQIHEGLCYQRALEKTATGKDIFDGFVQHFDQRGVSIGKIVSVTTDGSSCLVGTADSFVDLLQDNVKHVIISSPCILHQDDLCSMIYNGELKHVMDTIIKTVNHIASKPSHVHAKFQELLSEAEQAVGELSPRNNVRWMGGKALECFVSSLDDIRSFFGEKWQTFPELWNDFWLLKLAFLADLVQHLNDLNKRLQRKGQTIEVLYEQWKLFTSKLGVFRRDIQMGTFRYFVHVRKYTASKGPVAVDVQVLDGCIAALEQLFYERFQDLHHFGPMFPFIVRPDEFIDVDLDATFLSWLSADNLEMELLELKVSDLWCSKFRDLRRSLENQDDMPERETNIVACWNTLPDKFVSMKRVAIALLTAFGSTTCSEQTLTYLKHSVNRLRNRLTTENSETSARLKLTNYKPNVKKLCAEISSQGSH